MNYPVKKNTDITGFDIKKLETVNNNTSLDKTKTPRSAMIEKSKVLKRLRHGGSKKRVETALQEYENENETKES